MISSFLSLPIPNTKNPSLETFIFFLSIDIFAPIWVLPRIKCPWMNLPLNSIADAWKLKKIKIKADEKQLRQVIGNVIKNSSENFEENNIKNKIITFSSIFTHKNILLSIQDNGIGIKKANKIRVLEPYFTTKKNGTGLGLAISKKIIEDHQGEINIESSDKGTKVNIKFPIEYN